MTILQQLSQALADRYHVEEQIGEGGMAIVYRARDLKHNRTVAMKVLKPQLAAVVGAERFLAEIETTAGLQHPHILPLFDSGEADGFLYYVMPFVEGESLRERLERDEQLPVDEALALTRKMASALSYAHEQGVIHRDVKPANILLSRGEPLVADFGIAIALTQAGGERITETGLSLGTPHYMSPEQASGDRAPDARSDLYSLACVLYEMLAGDAPHSGGSTPAVLSRILTEDAPRVRTRRRATPVNVDAALARALERLPADRPGSVADWVRLLDDPSYRYGDSEAGGAESGSAVARNWKTASGVLALAVVVLVGLLLTDGGVADAGGEVFRAELVPPGTQGLLTPQIGSSVILSPDGRELVYAGQGDGDPWQFWVRPAGDLDARILPGSEVHFTPAFDPAGGRLALVSAEQTIDVFDLSTNSQRELTGQAGLIIDWNEDGWIYFYAADREDDIPLKRVDPETGSVEVVPFVLRSRGRASIWGTSGDVLPDGSGAFLTQVPLQQAGAGAASVAIVDFESGEHRILTPGFHPRYLEPGYLVWGTAQGRLMAQPFDLETEEFRGAPVVVAEEVMFDLTGVMHYAVSADGSLVYRRSPTETQNGSRLSWVGLDGEARLASEQEIGLTVGLWDAVSLSPDGDRATFAMSAGTSTHIFVQTLGSGSPPNRLTFDGILNVRPRFTPDGRSVTFVSDMGGPPTKLFIRPVDGTGSARPAVTADREVEEGFVSPDGEWYVYRLGGTTTNRDIYAVRTDGSGDPVPVVSTQASERAIDLSPDGRFLAYTSNETGRDEVFVVTFPDASLGKWQISADGGQWSRWGRTGDELYFESSDNRMWAARYTAEGTSFSVSEIRPLFSSAQFLTGSNTVGYDAHPDGERLLMIDIGTGAGGGLIWVRNWRSELQEMTAG